MRQQCAQCSSFPLAPSVVWLIATAPDSASLAVPAWHETDVPHLQKLFDMLPFVYHQSLPLFMITH
jgi:hypothetical protein